VNPESCVNLGAETTYLSESLSQGSSSCQATREIKAQCGAPVGDKRTAGGV